MSNIFGPRRGRVKPPKRNRFDMSHQHLTTTEFGLVKPFFCKEVIGGDSVSLDPVCAIRSHPIVFPINTRMRLYAHYFYVRNRTLWKDWESFIFKTKEGLVPPYLRLTPERAKKMISTGSLGDCLGVPSTVGQSPDLTMFYDVSYRSLTQQSISGSSPLPAVFTDVVSLGNAFRVLRERDARFTYSSLNTGYTLGGPGVNIQNITSSLPTDFSSAPFLSDFDSSIRPSSDGYFFFAYSTDSPYRLLSYPYPIEISYTLNDDGLFVLNYHIDPLQLQYFLSDLNAEEVDSYNIYIGAFASGSSSVYDAKLPFFPLIEDSTSLVPSRLVLFNSVNSIVDATDDSVIASNKFIGETPQIPLSALPFRACEMIANYFFRNDQNNPYTINGDPQYNQFIPSVDGGADVNEYLIHHRNWEFDAYTSAVPSPQFGAAPLVGVTYAGGREAELTFNGLNSDGQPQDFKVKVGLQDDGVIQSVIDFDKGTPSGSLRQLLDLSSVGISINDLRNVNAYQRFKENCLRRSLRYRDQMLSHLGVNVDYPDIDVPQFIGGFSGDLVVQPVTNMAETDSTMLGDVAGKIEAVIKSNHRITCYCPEHGFIIGMFSIVPVPTYSQILPKMFTRYDAFDYFQREFGKIGYVPIEHRELFPLQSSDPDKVFGYQRAWYDYMSSFDEVHGDFRTSLSDFVLYRQFKDEPTLNEDFTTVSSDSLNNIFAVDKVDEKYKNSEHFMVQFYHDAVFKRPIPKYGMPSLE